MGNVRSLQSSGLTNHQSEDFGTFISSALPSLSYSFCCGQTILDKHVDNCPVCSAALFWQKSNINRFEENKFNYIKKYNNQKLRALKKQAKKRLALMVA